MTAEQHYLKVYAEVWHDKFDPNRDHEACDIVARVETGYNGPVLHALEYYAAIHEYEKG